MRGVVEVGISVRVGKTRNKTFSHKLLGETSKALGYIINTP